MKFNRIISLGMALVFACTLQVAVQSSAVADTFKVGGTALELPPPNSDFTEVGYEARELMEIMVPTQNRLVSVFLFPDDLKRFQAQDETLTLKKYAMIQVPRRGEYMDFQVSDFNDLVQELEVSFDKEIESSFSEVEDELNRRMAAMDAEGFKLGAPVSLGKLFLKENAYASAMVSSITQDGESTKLVAGTLILRVKNRLLFVYLYAEYEDENTVKWIGETTEKWADAILAAN